MIIDLSQNVTKNECVPKARVEDAKHRHDIEFQAIGFQSVVRRTTGITKRVMEENSLQYINKLDKRPRYLWILEEWELHCYL
jgi:hypothetical protein